ncbi:sulfur oxidation c-type cytochrome SoxA [Propylenella binzhouense]|uniref:SoxAX cytochrome complex subunit A n=1 Tax=Propylenella binzhouense TaxID=2555902 RepID=A0A964T814_9HYPH|nr:sulfur oxidation c-type cytochrome SoxA [Propylenella binzhouense]MYZ49765.1 sulfur oxidation c-type cytochrome SoxA [Propylenella binzhouense]
MKGQLGMAGLGLAALLSMGSAASAQDADKLVINGDLEMTTRAPAPEGLPFEEVISGWHFREDETQALETDDFDNPGMLMVERGQDLWNEVQGAAGKSCASCHGEAAESMKGVGAKTPFWSAEAKRPVNLELQINQCRTERMQAEPYKFDDPDQIAMVSFVRFQSRGMPVKLDLDQGDMKAWWERGKELYYTRFGQLDFSCASCHEQNAGKYLRADYLSQGQINGFPTYRLKDATLISTHNRFKGCVRDTRAEPFQPLSDEFMALEVYVAWRGTGLAVETPAVRH